MAWFDNAAWNIEADYTVVWLRDELKAGARKLDDIIQAGRQKNISFTSISMAVQELDVCEFWDEDEQAVYWMLDFSM